MRPAWVVAVAVALAATVTASATAAADPFQRVLTGSFGGRLSAARGAPEGWFLGVETGRAWLLDGDAMASGARAAVADDSDSAWTFGARAGYQLRSGLAIQRAVRRSRGRHRPGRARSFVGVGRRALLVADRHAVRRGARRGRVRRVRRSRHRRGRRRRVASSLARHVAFDAALRDWIADIDGGIRHIPTVTVGIDLGFGG